MSLTITALYASLAGLLLLFLSFRVVRWRRKLSVGLGDGGQESLLRAQRAQANFTEYVPIALILLAAAESQGLAGWLLQTAGAILMLARLLHAWGLSQSSGRSFGRYWGTLLTWVVILALSLANIFAIISGAVVG
ncbi:MAG: MAPEG family protein [Gammaproteobacteria bacterium]|nr:MAPEG family protein [Gammaproteobacteria bacterium]